MTQPEKSSTPATSSGFATPDRLRTDEGKISVAQSVVQKIAGIACREISGVHAMGTSTGRTFGAIARPSPAR
jgi:uncharacterized alkaline shock family protein YloU